ncbi:MAG: YdcF family protein [Gammaproteobacteria bacterium]|nr:YdcF family protein [Gammaproteobacteria bacterium]
MLPRQDDKVDIDGYAMLLLSLLVMAATAGLSYAYLLRKIFLTAKNETHQCEDDVMLFVLGKKLKNNQPDIEYEQRLKRAQIILNKDKASQVIILGGKTGKATISEAHAGKDFLQRYNIDVSRIHLEQASRNTLENIHNAIKLLETKNKKIVVVTNRYHLARAKQMANGHGLEVKLCAAEEKPDMRLLSILKLMLEAVHMHWYKSGRFYARLTNNQRMLYRIGKY